MTESQNVVDLRAAIALGGRVRVAPGRYFLSSPLVLTGATSLIGDYRDLCTIDGSRMADPSQPIIQIDRMWGYEISNITVTGNRATNAVGILNTTNTPSTNGSYGTVSGSAIFSHVLIMNCQTGMVIGDGSKLVAASENVYTQLTIIRCDTCIKLSDYNTLDHKFIMLQMGDCNIGMVTQGASYISVDGGSFSSCFGVLFDMTQCSAASFRDCRMEESGVFLRCGTTGTAGRTIVDGCEIHQRKTFGTDNTSAYANGWKSPIAVGGYHFLNVKNTFISCTSVGWPAIYSLCYGYVEATGNTCTIDPSGNMFFGPNKTTFVNNLSAAPNGKIFTRNNAWVDAGQVLKGWYPDQAN